jgi:hypothetical protein
MTETIEKYKELAACMYQFAGAHDAPEYWLNALSAAASGEPFQTDHLLPYAPSVHERFQPSEEWLLKMAKAEEECGGFIGAGDTPYNRLVHTIAMAQAAQEKDDD